MISLLTCPFSSWNEFQDKADLFHQDKEIMCDQFQEWQNHSGVSRKKSKEKFTANNIKSKTKVASIASDTHSLLILHSNFMHNEFVCTAVLE